MRLATFPSGGTLFLDANCLLYHFLNSRQVCTDTLYRSEIGDIRTVTSAVVVGEVRHRLMVLEASQRFTLPPRTVVAHLRRHPDRIRLLRACTEAVESLARLRVDILPVSADLLLASQRVSVDCGLLTNDALIVTTMRTHHLVHLATNDTDFRRVPNVTLWTP